MSESQVKNGKMSVSMKNELDKLSAYHDEPVEQASFFTIDPILEKTLKDAGLHCRWINAGDYKKAGGYHKNGWKPLKMTDVPDKVRAAISIGGAETAEGYFVRNDLMLAVRGARVQAHHEQQLANKANRQMNVQKDQADRLREHLGGAGKVTEGFEQNE